MKIMFDIGATNTRIGSSRDDETIERITTYSTPAEYGVGLKSMIEAIDELRGDEEIESIVGGFPSSFRSDGAIHNAAHLPGWSDNYLRGDLEKQFSAPVYIGNDLEFDELEERRVSTKHLAHHQIKGAFRRLELVALVFELLELVDNAARFG